jgi:hypothetical protein
MAPLSYYWLISFIYLVMKMPFIPIGEFYGLAGTTRRKPAFRRIFLLQDFFLLAKYPPPAQKKRYVYMFQLGIMNYKG